VLASNEIKEGEKEFAARHYIPEDGFAHLLGYVKYPSKDSSGFYYKEDYNGVAGVEKFFDKELAGKNGLRIVETNALGLIQSESLLQPPSPGNDVTLSVDARVQKALFERIKELAERVGFEGGAGIIMDVESGEILALTSFPEYNSEILADGTDSAAIKRFVSDGRKPFLNRATDGLYTPGSIVKPFIAIGALNEKIIDPLKEITSTGSISVPNPYDPKKKSVFTDWKAHGAVDMRKALAVSSNVYFYEVGGGYGDQKGLGIAKIEEYMKRFGFGMDPGGEFWGKKGIIPNPEWKKEMFKGDDWRIGDTYNTAIGQYGVQVTPFQAVRGMAAVANGGNLLDPSILKILPEEARYKDLELDEEYFKVVREGLRQGVIEGTASGLDVPFVKVAAKTGTAELGTLKKKVNSWALGFFPYEKPRYAFVVIMERGPRDNTIGGLYVMRELFEWMNVYAPEYLRSI